MAKMGCTFSFSGGKDSTVLLHIVREMYPNIPAVYCNTGLEYPEITQFVKTFDNVTILKPKMSFFKVCEKYGFPLISKEVSECVSGARKYLKQVLTSMPESEIALTDRQTDRARNGITRSIDNFVGKANTPNPIKRWWSIPQITSQMNRFGKQYRPVKSGGWRSQRLCKSHWNPNVYATHC